MKPEKPVMEFYDEGDDWLTIVYLGKTRYLKKAIAQKILYSIGSLSVTEKSNIIVRERDLCPSTR